MPLWVGGSNVQTKQTAAHAAQWAGQRASRLYIYDIASVFAINRLLFIDVFAVRERDGCIHGTARNEVIFPRLFVGEVGLFFGPRPKTDAGNAIATHDRDAVCRERPFVDDGIFVEQAFVGFDERFAHDVIFGQNPCREVAFGRIYQIGIGRIFVFLHRNGDVVAPFLDGGQIADFLQARFSRFASGHSAIERNGARVGDGATARRREEDFRRRNRTTTQELGVFPKGIVFGIEHLDQALDLGAVGGIVFVERTNVLDDVGHFMDGI